MYYSLLLYTLLLSPLDLQMCSTIRKLLVWEASITQQYTAIIYNIHSFPVRQMNKWERSLMNSLLVQAKDLLACSSYTRLTFCQGLTVDIFMRRELLQLMSSNWALLHCQENIALGLASLKRMLSTSLHIHQKLPAINRGQHLI